ncbi:20S proteasome subunit alpha 7 [Pancytospora epiphaga]|nr:20S proteasome subunit alpha 7 [Pancytospora epiphaga]
MSELDFSNIYDSSGEVVQVRYAGKAVDNGSTIIALRNSKGAVMIVSKPVSSPLYNQETDYRIRKVADNVYMGYTGVLPDGFFISNLCKKNLANYQSNFNEPAGFKFFRETLRNYLYMFTQYSSARVVGASFLAIVREGNTYKVMGAEPSGDVTEYYGYAYGVGGTRAKTEIEKLSLEDMEVGELAEQGIRTLFKCRDPLSDVQFAVEVGMISDDADGEFVRMSNSTVARIMEKYKDLSADGEEY